MTTWPDVPDFGGLLRPHLDKVPASALPTFLAALERSAAARGHHAQEVAQVLAQVQRRAATGQAVDRQEHRHRLARQRLEFGCLGGAHAHRPGRSCVRIGPARNPIGSS